MKPRYVVDVEGRADGVEGIHIAVVDTSTKPVPQAVALCGRTEWNADSREKSVQYAERICAYLNLLNAEGRAP